MKKFALFLVAILIMALLAGCGMTVKPQDDINKNTAGQKNNVKATTYPYKDIKVDDIKEIEVYSAMATTPVRNDAATLDKVAQLIREAKFAGDDSSQGSYGTCGWGMRVELKEDKGYGKSISICYVNGEGKELRMGPQGVEYLVESEELGSYIMDTLKNKYSMVTSETLPSEVQSWLESFDNTKGAYVYQHPFYTYVAIFAGEKGTGGYDVKIRDFIDGDFEKKFVVEFTEPAPDQMVDQALTYPAIYIKLQSDNISQYTFSTSGGESLKTEDKSILAAFETPVKGQKVSGTVKAKGKIAAFEGSFVLRLVDDKGDTLKEEIMQTAGAPAWGTFDTELEIPSSTKGSLYIVSGEYSAKDGEFVEHARVEVLAQ